MKAIQVITSRCEAPYLSEFKPFIMPLRRSNRLAIKEAIRFARQRDLELEERFAEPEPAAAAAPVASDPREERQRIIATLSDCKNRCCAQQETKKAHEAVCEWCRARPAWRMIVHNLTIQMEAFENTRTKEAKRSAALGIVSYINDHVVEFAKAHEKFRITILDRCEHFIAESGDNVLLRMVSSEVKFKLGHGV